MSTEQLARELAERIEIECFQWAHVQDGQDRYPFLDSAALERVLATELVKAYADGERAILTKLALHTPADGHLAECACGWQANLEPSTPDLTTQWLEHVRKSALPVEAAPATTPHVPLLELNGQKIEGLKRCAVCGISETYWSRWPNCPNDLGAPSEAGDK